MALDETATSVGVTGEAARGTGVPVQRSELATHAGASVESQADAVSTVERVFGVDILRGCCALAVMAYHFSHWSGYQTSGILDGALQKAGIYGVEAFFVISGFSLYIASARRDFSRWRDVRIFLVKRSLRILPLLFAATAATVAMMWAGGHDVSALTVVANFALVPIILNPASAIATGAWSLGVEWGFYLLFPILMLFRARLGWTLGIGCIVLAVYALLLKPTDLASQSALYVSIPNHFAFFAAGMALGKWRPKAIGNLAFATTVAVLLAGFAFTMPVVNDQAAIVSGWSRGFFFLLSVALVAAFAAWRGGRSPALIWLGNISFGLYITHPLVFGACKYVLGLGVPAVALAIVLTLVASTVSYYGFERPILNWGGRWTLAVRS